MRDSFKTSLVIIYSASDTRNTHTKVLQTLALGSWGERLKY